MEKVQEGPKNLGYQCRCGSHSELPCGSFSICSDRKLSCPHVSSKIEQVDAEYTATVG